MPASTYRRWQPILLALTCAVLVGLTTGCSSLDNASQRVAGLVTPYKVEVIQGNFVSQEQAALLRPGMPRAQVMDVLGTPLMTSIFHADRWDYVFTLKRRGADVQPRRFTVFFKGDALERFEGAEGLPSEAEFVSTLDTRPKTGKIPELQASEESLKKFSATAKPAKPATPSGGSTDATTPASATSYPPLEGSAR